MTDHGKTQPVTKSARYAQRRADRTSRRSAGSLGASAGTLTVYKDARGQSRWLAVTTTAFQDRDTEIISRAALKADVARTDRDGQYGPLRYWHVGTPDPQNADAPWGQGADLGTCDFSALSASGLSLIESGTFKTEAIAQAVAAVADRLEMSPGFFHPRSEPRDGVYHTIRRFERSIVPTWAGRASNLFTAFATKRSITMDATKRKALEQMGLGSADLQAFLEETTAREKAAQAQGVALKSATPATVTIDGQVFNLVPAAAPEPPPAPTTPEPDAPADPTPEDTEPVIGDMTPTEFKAFLAPLLAPVATKAAPAEQPEIAALKSELDTLKAQIAALTADQPPATARAYRATQDPKTAIKAQSDQQAGPLAGIVAMMESVIPGSN